MNLAGLIGVVFAAMLMAASAEETSTTVSGFKVPEFDEDGNKTSLLTGDFAKMAPDGDIEITNLRMEFYKDDEVESLMTAPKCTYNQRKGLAYSRSSVKMSREGMEVTGRGFAYDRTNELFRIFSDVRVLIKGARQHAEIPGDN